MSIVDVEKEARKVLTGLGFKEAQFDAPFDSLSGRLAYAMHACRRLDSVCRYHDP